MDLALTAAASAMTSAEQALEYNAQDLANVSTPAYRTQQPYFESAFSALWNNGDGSSQTLPWGVQVQPGGLSTEPGTFHGSSNPLSAALSDPNDYFTIQTPQGTGYTRDGDFHLASDGSLVTSAGYPVMGEFGALQAGAGASAQLTAQGQFQPNGGQAQPLKIVHLDPAALQRQGSQVFTLADGSSPADAQGHVLSGQLEGSGVDVFKGMADLVMLMRWAESAQKAARAADDAAGALIQAAKL